MMQPHAPLRLKRMSYRPDRAALGKMQQRPGDPGKQVRVLVCIKMRDVNARPLQLLHLRHGLPLDIILADIASQQRLHKVQQVGPERLPIAAQQRRNVVRMRDRNAVGQHNMATDAQPRVSLGNGNGIVKRRPCSHQRSRGQYSGLMQLTNGAIDASSKAKVVRIDDEAGSHGGMSEQDRIDSAKLAVDSTLKITKRWWAVRDSNPRHPACKAGALTS